MHPPTPRLPPPRRWLAALFAAAVGLATPGACALRPAVSPSEDASVGDDAVAEAKHHLSRGTALLDAGLYHQAIERLRAALARWDHPRIHDQLATALLKLRLPAEGIIHLWWAGRDRGDPGDAAASRARRRAHHLLPHVAHLVVHCAGGDGGTPRVDGAEPLAGPGPWEALIAADPAPTVTVTCPGGDPREVPFGRTAMRRIEVRVDAAAETVEVESTLMEPPQIAALQRRAVGFEVAPERPFAERREPSVPAPAPAEDNPFVSGVCARAWSAVGGAGGAHGLGELEGVPPAHVAVVVARMCQLYDRTGSALTRARTVLIPTIRERERERY